MVLLLDLAAWQATFLQFGADVLADARDIYLAAIEKIFLKNFTSHLTARGSRNFSG